MPSNMMVYVSLHSVVPIIAIQPEIRYVLSISDSREVLIIRRHMFECNLTVNCHIINSTLYPIRQLNRWLTRLDSTSCRACRTPRDRRRREDMGANMGESCPLHSFAFVYPCTIASSIEPKIELDMLHTDHQSIPFKQLMLNGLLL